MESEFPLKAIMFYFFAFTTIASALIITFHKNLIYCTISLLFTLLGVAGFFVLMNADFLAVTQVIVYIGGVLVLFLFALFLTNRIGEVNITNQSMTLPYAIPAGMLFCAFIIYVILKTPFKKLVVVNTNPTTSGLGDLLLSNYLLPFEIISVLLLSALVGSIFIARREVKPSVKYEEDKK